jgi:hypothetical protein
MDIECVHRRMGVKGGAIATRAISVPLGTLGLEDWRTEHQKSEVSTFRR